MKNLLILSLFILLTSCGYQPLFSSKDVPFSIIKVNYDNSVNSKKIIQNLKRYENTKSKNSYEVTLSTTEQRNEISKSKKNDLSNYRIIINSVVKVEQNNNILLNKEYNKSFDYQGSEKKFDQTQYEKNLKNSLLDKMSNEIIRDLFSIK
tara:strand:+ start:532 stop:981 length:450 start_codon:yes stop_codon:yes gene_type:complete